MYEEGLEKMNKSEDESNTQTSDPLTKDNIKKMKDKEEERKSNRKNKNDAKKPKKGSGTLRESSSMEDLVSKSKQSDSVRDIRKQVTVDDGNMALNTYHCSSNKKDKYDHLLKNRPFNNIKNTTGTGLSRVNNEDNQGKSSDFVADFYSVGDSFLSTDVPVAPSSPAGGDFEVVNSKKKGKRSRNGYQNSRSFECDRFSGNSNFSGSVHSDEGFRGPRFGHAKSSHHYNGGFERPHINFVEVPRTAHENTFIAQWSHLGVGDRYGAERYTGTTTSAPHSEDSGSDGDDSVHSMPVPSITPRPDVRKPPPSSDSTPQTSYANIAKLAATANRAQMKRMIAPTLMFGSSTLRELEGEPFFNEDTEMPDARLPSVNESRPTNILDDNFPSLAESLGCNAMSVSPGALKGNEPRTNLSGESSTNQPNSTLMIENNEQCKELSESDCIKETLLDPSMSDAKKAPVDKNELVANPTQTRIVQEHHHHHHHHHHHVSTLPPQDPVVKQHHQGGQTNVFYQKTTNNVSNANINHPPPPPSQQQSSYISTNTTTEQQNIHKAVASQDVTTPQQASASSLPPEHSHHHHHHHTTPSPHQPQPHHILHASQHHSNTKQYSQPPPPLPQSQPPHHTHPNLTTQHSTPHNTSSQPHLLAHQQKVVVVHPQSAANKEKSPPNTQPNMSIHPNSHSKHALNSQKSAVKPPKDAQPAHSHTQTQTEKQQNPPLEQNTLTKTAVKAQSDATGGSDERQPYTNNRKCHSKARNGPSAAAAAAAHLVQSSDTNTSRGRKLEPAVVFTDNAKFSHRVSGIEFGFGFDEPIVTTSDGDENDNDNDDSSVSESVEDSNLKCNVNNNNNNILNNHTVTKDFCKWFKAPKNDKISYNYEELIKHVSKGNDERKKLLFDSI